MNCKQDFLCEKCSRSEHIKPSRAPGSPCQGSWRRRRLRGSHNVPFSPSASLMLGSSLVRGSQESENIRLAEKPILILTNFPYFLQKLLTQALGYAKITKKVNIVLLPAGKKKAPADLLNWRSTSPDKLCARTHNHQPDFRRRREDSISYSCINCKRCCWGKECINSFV